MSDPILRGPINPIEPAAYTPDPSLFTNSTSAREFYCPSSYDETLPTSKILYTYNNSVLLSLDNFMDIPGSRHIEGTKAVNSWDVKEPLSNFLDFQSNANVNSYDEPYLINSFVARGSFVNFHPGKKLLEVGGGPDFNPAEGIYYYKDKYCDIYFKNNLLHIEVWAKVMDSLWTGESVKQIYSKTYRAIDFKDHILPRRLIIIMQGGGGGGGGAWGDNSRNGGGGGSGGFFACVINTEILWQSSKNYYRFYIGGLGAQGQGAAEQSGRNGQAGGDSKMVVTLKNGGLVADSTTTTTLLIAGGGGGGGKQNTAGKAGIVTNSNGTSLSDLDNSSTWGYGTLFWWLPYSNYRSFEHGLAGIKGTPGSTHRISTNQQYLYNIPLEYSEKDLGYNKQPIGNYTSGKVANSDGGGAGAPSYFGPGGNSGGYGSNTTGKAPSSGYGGGGGGGTYIVMFGGGDNNMGGAGAPGMLQIYAYDE